MSGGQVQEQPKGFMGKREETNRVLLVKIVELFVRNGLRREPRDTKGTCTVDGSYCVPFPGSPAWWWGGWVDGWLLLVVVEVVVVVWGEGSHPTL